MEIIEDENNIWCVFVDFSFSNYWLFHWKNHTSKYNNLVSNPKQVNINSARNCFPDCVVDFVCDTCFSWVVFMVEAAPSKRKADLIDIWNTNANELGMVTHILFTPFYSPWFLLNRSYDDHNTCYYFD